MSNYIGWAKHPETHHWHRAYFIDDHFGAHHYGVRFNDDKIFSTREHKIETSDKEPGPDEIIDGTRDQFAEIFGYKEGQKPPTEPEEKTNYLINEKFKNILAFVVLMAGDKTLAHSPDYILEKFYRYAGSDSGIEDDSYKWGLDSRNNLIWKEYINKWFDKNNNKGVQNGQ